MSINGFAHDKSSEYENAQSVDYAGAETKSPFSYDRNTLRIIQGLVNTDGKEVRLDGRVSRLNYLPTPYCI